MIAARVLARADAVLVDLDGTLVDSSAPVRRVWYEFAARHGLDGEVVHRFAQGRPSRETVRLLAPDADRRAEAAWVEEVEVRDTRGVRALPGARRLLSGSRPLAIVTSCSTALAESRLAAAGLPRPPVLVSSDGLAHGKPDPECFLIAARLLGVDPARCVVLEDSPTGIAAGRAAGATVIALRTTHGDDELDEADAIVDDLASVLDSLVVSANEVDEYLRGLEEPKRSTLEALRTTILQVIPEAEQVISYGLPAFRVEGTTVAGFGAFRNHLSYLPFSGSVLPGLADELEGYTMTKSSLHFPIDAPLPRPLVEKLIAVRLAEHV